MAFYLLKIMKMIVVVDAQSLSPVQLFVTAACQVSMSFTVFWSLLKLMSIKLVMPSNHLVLSHPLLLLPSIFPSLRVFFPKELALHIRWPKDWSSSFSISSPNEYSGLISFSIDRFDLLAIQGTLKSSPALQFESINSLAVKLFMVQFSHPYMTTGKTIALSV